MTNWAKHTQSSLYYTLCTNNWLRNWIEQSAKTSWIFRIHPNYLVIYPYTFKNFFSFLNTYTQPIHLLHLSRCLNKHLHTKFIQFSWAIRINRSKKTLPESITKKNQNHQLYFLFQNTPHTNIQNKFQRDQNGK